MRRQWRKERARFEEGPRFSGAKRTETGWVNGVFLLHAGRKDFFDTLTISTIKHLKSCPQRGTLSGNLIPARWSRRS